jgi:hypothetical protein
MGDRRLTVKIWRRESNAVIGIPTVATMLPTRDRIVHAGHYVHIDTHQYTTSGIPNYETSPAF